MPVYDPTSVAHSLPMAPKTAWAVEDVARIQAEMVQALAPTAPVTAPAAVPVVRDVAQQTTVSGRYRGNAADFELELRIDVDGLRPTRRVSGDFFQRSGGTMAYIGSFIVNTPDIQVGPDQIVIEGEGVYSFDSGSPRLRIAIPRVPDLMPRAPATAQFLTSAGIPGQTFSCNYESPFLRAIEFERDIVEGIQPFEAYDTGRLLSGGPARVLTVPAAFGEAGIEMIDLDPGDPVPIDLAGADRIWSNRELHAAMERHFSRWSDEPAWRVWLLAATIHEEGPGLRGIMFDAMDQRQRQGCAVFHDVIGGTGDRVTRAMLRTYVHELGHCFNLYHSHQKEFMNPPQPNRLDALSWMHYPANYRGAGGSGEAAYWRAFPFQFDDGELINLRHGFRDAVIPGGQPFGLGAADIDPGMFADQIADESGLELEIRAPDRFMLGTPVVIELKLSLLDLRGRTVNTKLHPNFGYVQVAIARLGGKPKIYRPLITHCIEPELVMLDRNRPSIYESSYIGFGKDGFYFDAPGQYELRALYNAPDGSRVISNVLRLRVKAPLTREEDEVADLFIGTEQGTLLYLLGSESESLRRGRDAFATVIEKYPDNPMASYAYLVEGMSASRPFKRIEDHKVVSQPADFGRSENMLSAVVGATTPSGKSLFADTEAPSPSKPRLDNISLNMVMQRLAEMRKEAGNDAGASTMAIDIVRHFENLQVPPHVRERIIEQVSKLLTEEQIDGLRENGAAPSGNPPSGNAGGGKARSRPRRK
jgi:hypothetical protein